LNNNGLRFFAQSGCAAAVAADVVMVVVMVEVLMMMVMVTSSIVCSKTLYLFGCPHRPLCPYST
jgi:hypothetical protein